MSDVSYKRIEPTGCPHCGKRLDAVATLHGAIPTPQPGDLHVCLGCANVMEFDSRLQTRKVSAATLAALDPESAAVLKETQNSVRAFLESDPR